MVPEEGAKARAGHPWNPRLLRGEALEFDSVGLDDGRGREQASQRVSEFLLLATWGGRFCPLKIVRLGAGRLLNIGLREHAAGIVSIR